MKSRLIRGNVDRLLVVQFGLSLFVAAILWMFFTLKIAYSALLGGFVCLVPTWIFARYVFKYGGAQAVRKIAASFYWGEAVKFFVTIGLFAGIFITIPIEPLPFFCTFIAAQLVFWFAPLLMD